MARYSHPRRGLLSDEFFWAPQAHWTDLASDHPCIGRCFANEDSHPPVFSGTLHMRCQELLNSGDDDSPRAEAKGGTKKDAGTRRARKWKKRRIYGEIREKGM